MGKQNCAFSVGALIGGLMAGVQVSLPIDICVSQYEPTALGLMEAVLCCFPWDSDSQMGSISLIWLLLYRR